MRATITVLILLAATTANAFPLSTWNNDTGEHSQTGVPYVEYDIDTGGVTIKDIEPGTDMLYIHYPARWNLVEDFYDPRIEYREGLKRFHPHSTGHTSLRSFLEWKQPKGFPSEFFVGNIMEPDADDGWEDLYFDLGEVNYPPGHRPEAAVTVLGLKDHWINGHHMGGTSWLYGAFTVVPEPSTMALLLIFGLAMLLEARIYWKGGA